MTINYTPAPEVETIANDLILRYHQHLIDYNVRIEYVFVDKTPKSNGYEVWGTCKKISNLNAFLANSQSGSDPFFVITISEPVWEVLPQNARIALVDHELCHAWAEVKESEDDDESVKLSTNPHDLEEFTCIVRRHGLWRDNVQTFVDAALNRRN